MKTLTRITSLLVMLSLLAGGAAVQPPPATAQAAPIVWNLPTVAAPTYYHTVHYQAWGAKVTEADVATILDEHIKGGQPAAKLNPDAVWK